jgi:anaerobic ribonucleoside-triphosphate reductase activating protein
VLRVATISEDTEAEGPGRRWALWVQGCSIRCPGCCNPEMFSSTGGAARAIDDVIEALRGAAKRGIEGISVLGGEPFEQAVGVAAIARAAKQLGLTVMVYSGYTLDELQARPDAGELLALTDLLVDGRYDRERPEPPPPVGRRWLGSTNQTMHFLTGAYRADDPQMRAANTVELHWSKGRLLVNGWPAGADTLAVLKRRLPKTS